MGLLDLAGGETVLDVGCGPGESFDLLAEAVGPGGRAVGTDYSRGTVRRARARAGDRAAVVHGDATALSVADDVVDAALASLCWRVVSREGHGVLACSARRPRRSRWSRR